MVLPGGPGTLCDAQLPTAIIDIKGLIPFYSGYRLVNTGALPDHLGPLWAQVEALTMALLKGQRTTSHQPSSTSCYSKRRETITYCQRVNLAQESRVLLRVACQKATS